MLRRTIQALFVLMGTLIGYQGGPYLLRQELLGGSWLTPGNAAWLGAIVGAVLGLIGGPPLIRAVGQVRDGILATLHRTPASDLVVGAIGLFVGLIIAILATIPLPRDLFLIGDYLPLAVTTTIGYLSMAVAIKKKDELLSLFSVQGRLNSSGTDRKEKARYPQKVTPKILDTSVIIDGRIADLCLTGFLEGPLVVPGFVLEELQHVADSSDVLKRNRGRRGLDILQKMQKESHVLVQVYDRDFHDSADVDAKLVRLAKMLGARVVTNDFNLNKVAELHGVSVLNINELANALKPIVLPGEEMVVQVVKDGKEHGQGVAYLDDGTMIVVDGGRKFIGETVGVLVTSILQTAAGRMIFAKPKAMERAL